jgi:hypothetical protein
MAYASVADLVEDYYAALRAGEPLYPYFRESPATVKYGLSETLRGYEAVAAGLREQTRTTTDWVVESRDLTASDGGTVDGDAVGGTGSDGAACGWFADDVRLAWTDTDRRVRYEFETRWSGTVAGGEFATMHVSTADSGVGGSGRRDGGAGGGGV